jgi:hypothetical protein
MHQLDLNETGVPLETSPLTTLLRQDRIDELFDSLASPAAANVLLNAVSLGSATGTIAQRR